MWGLNHGLWRGLPRSKSIDSRQQNHLDLSILDFRSTIADRGLSFVPSFPFTAAPPTRVTTNTITQTICSHSHVHTKRHAAARTHGTVKRHGNGEKRLTAIGAQVSKRGIAKRDVGKTSNRKYDGMAIM